VSGVKWQRMDAKPYLLTLTPAFTVLGAVLLEGLMLQFGARGKYDWRAMLTSLAMSVGSLASGLIPIFIAMPGAFWAYEHRLFKPEALGSWSYVLLFMGVEFLYYWGHRAGHQVRWFWVSHGVHHSSNDLNLSTTVRNGWTDRIMANYVVYVPLVLLGFHPQRVLFALGIGLGYQFWIHVDWIPKLGPVEGILNTPSAHRVHHASNIEYVDRNYGLVSMIFDRLFGTYQRELDSVPIRYGLVNPLYTYDPFELAFQQLKLLMKDLRQARSVRAMFVYLFGPPGWRPEGNGDTTHELRSRSTAPALATTHSGCSLALDAAPDGPGNQ